MSTIFFYFDIQYAVRLHDWIIANSGGASGSINLGQLESVLEHIQNDFYYPDIDQKREHLTLLREKG